jgi:flagellar hook-associated protein 3 FlgL
MQFRPTQNSTFRQIDNGLLANLSRLVKAQGQVASGKRITRPSEDPVAASRALNYARHIAGAERYSEASGAGRTRLDFAAGRLQDASVEITDARTLLLQGLNGTLNADDRKSLATQVRILRDRLLEAANARDADGFLFAGTATDTQPFTSKSVHGRPRTSYVGNADEPELLAGDGLRVATGVAGDAVFAAIQRTDTQFSGLTGLAGGTSGDTGTGAMVVTLRHDGTSGALGAGLAFAAGGAADTLLGTHTLSVDAAAGTVQLDAGPVLAIPQPGDPQLADFMVTDENGAELHLDFSAYTSVDFTGSVDGAGSISLDGTTWTALDFVAADLQLDDLATGTQLHVDTTGIRRAGSELVLFGGSVNLFDTLQGIADDLDNVDELTSEQVAERLGLWLEELDRNGENVIGALGVVGGRSARLAGIGDRLGGEHAEFVASRSTLVDTDYSEAVLEMTRAEQALQLAQATATRLFSNSLLNFLR